MSCVTGITNNSIRKNICLNFSKYVLGNKFDTGNERQSMCKKLLPSRPKTATVRTNRKKKISNKKCKYKAFYVTCKHKKVANMTFWKDMLFMIWDFLSKIHIDSYFGSIFCTCVSAIAPLLSRVINRITRVFVIKVTRACCVQSFIFLGHELSLHFGKFFRRG